MQVQLSSLKRRQGNAARVLMRRTVRCLVRPQRGFGQLMGSEPPSFLAGAARETQRCREVFEQQRYGVRRTDIAAMQRPTAAGAAEGVAAQATSVSAAI